MNKLLLAALLVSAAAQAEPKFNPLDRADPRHEVYQRYLCNGTREVYVLFAADREELDRETVPVSGRESWVENYAMTTELRDKWRNELVQNCR